RRILVVDDNKDAAESLALLLQLARHEVQIALDGSAALEVARTFRPEVVLIDIGLPDMNGYEVARHLRNWPELAGARLVAITGYGQEEDRRLSLEAGFSQHLTKPVDPEELLRLLETAHAG